MSYHKYGQLIFMIFTSVTSLLLARQVNLVACLHVGYFYYHAVIKSNTSFFCNGISILSLMKMLTEICISVACNVLV